MAVDASHDSPQQPCRHSARRPVVGVMGGGEVTVEQATAAYELGRLIAENGWTLLNGGRNAGIMDASAKGAKEAGGLTIGILPDNHARRASPFIDIQIVTGMGSARNNINVLSSDVVVACSGGAGTLSEIALALKAERPVIVLDAELGGAFTKYVADGRLAIVKTPSQAVDAAKELLCARTPQNLT